MLAIIALSPSHGTPGPPDGGKIWSNYLSLSHFQLFLHWKTISDVPADQLYMHSITVSCSSLWFHVWDWLCHAGVPGGHTLPDPNPPLFMTPSHRAEFTLLSLTWWCWLWCNTFIQRTQRDARQGRQQKLEAGKVKHNQLYFLWLPSLSHTQ